MTTNRPNDQTRTPGDDPHVRWEVLNDFVDGRLDAAAAEGARVHLAECTACRGAADALRELSHEARRLKPSLEPDEALWGEIAQVIAAGGGGDPRIRVEHPGLGTPSLPHPRDARSHTRGRPFLASPRWLAAAAVALMALSSGVTAYLMRDRSIDVAEAGDGRGAARAAALPAGFTASEKAFLADVAELDALLATQRQSLSPATIAVVERSLATIDAAIAEARVALLADPANQQLAELLAANYRQKVELMRRAAEFPNSI